MLRDWEPSIHNTSGWDAYAAVNEKFCTALLELYQPGDIIWIHDYPLLLLANLVRKEKTVPPKRRRANDLVFNSDCYTFFKKTYGSFGLIK